MIKIKVLYLKEDDKPNIGLQLINYIKDKDNNLIIQPIKKVENNKQLEKIIKKIKKKCIKKNVHNVVVSKKLQKNEYFLKHLYAYNINILDGKWLLKYMAYDVIDYIMQKTHRKKEETEIAILVNNITNEALENIKMLVKEFKRVNIVTNHINEFRYLEKKVYDEYGMMMTITNNKRKSLEKAKLILNFDFTTQIINQYNIFEKAIIVNLINNVRIKKKRFNGLNIIDYEITSIREFDYFDFEKLNFFFLKDLVEANFYRKDSFHNIRHSITRDYYKIKELYGINGRVM